MYVNVRNLPLVHSSLTLKCYKIKESTLFVAFTFSILFEIGSCALHQF